MSISKDTDIPWNLRNRRTNTTFEATRMHSARFGDSKIMKTLEQIEMRKVTVFHNQVMGETIKVSVNLYNSRTTWSWACIHILIARPYFFLSNEKRAERERI